MTDTHIKVSGANVQCEINSWNISVGALRILFERYRVMDKKGYTAEIDLARYEDDELCNAAGAYLFGPGPTAKSDGTPFCWPFGPQYYKGGKDRIADLVRAGQFIAAEIDRLLLEAENSKNPIHGKPGEPGISFAPLGEDETDKDELRMTPENSFEPGNGSDPATWFEGMLDRPDSTKD